MLISAGPVNPTVEQRAELEAMINSAQVRTSAVPWARSGLWPIKMRQSHSELEAMPFP